MKKLIALLCMITCIMGLTACGSEPVYNTYEQQRLADAELYAVQVVLPMFQEFQQDEALELFDMYTAEEIEYLYENYYTVMVDGNATKNAALSFNSTLKTIGDITGTGEITSKIDGKTIVVNVEVSGTVKDADAEIILSNDMFMRLESAALNEKSTMGDMMGKAALNTLIGMGTVFVVLILISFIISLFGLIPKMQEKIAKKKEAKKAKANGVDNAIAQIVEAEENVEASDDLELVAVIAAAIAAYEGAGSTDGFVVRSIRKVNRTR